MKNYTIRFVMAMFFVGSLVITAKADKIEPLSAQQIKSMSETEIAERVEQLEARVQELNAMDMSSMSKAEKKDVKKELRDIKKENKAMASSGIYLSTGAIIIIILLLILLL